jgi:ribose transport system permease protein
MTGFFRGSKSALLLLTAMLAAFSLTQKAFFALDNLVNIGVQISLLGLMTLGMALIVITGNLDLSVGSVAALSGIVFASLADFPSWLAALFAIGAGVVVGALNGVLIGKFRFNSIIATLATMALGEGLALWASRGYPVPGESDDFEMLGGGFLLYIPLPIVFFGACAAAAYIVLTQTQFGRNLYAVGSNIELAVLCDIPVTLCVVVVYMLSAALSAFAGIILASRLDTASPLVGQDAPLQALVAIVIGGTPLSGGEGGVGNIVLGLLIVSVLSNGLNLWNIPPANRWGITGALLILFAMLDRSRQRSRFAQEGT